MGDRLRAVRNRLGFAELVIVGIVVMAFAIGGVIWGTPVTIFRTCAGFSAECPPDEWVRLNPAAGLLAAAAVALALTVLDLVMRRRQP